MRSASQVDTMVSDLVAGRYNAVIVQVLAYMDNGSGSSHGAYWKSSILPRCGYVTSSFDPLAYVCQRAHANGIQVHAWLGGSGGAMYRVSLDSAGWPPIGNATLAAHPEWMMVPRADSEGNAVVPVNGNYLLDMGSSDAQEYLVSIVRELVTNYEIDGIHWDDEHGSAEYNAGLGFPAYSTATYTNSGLARYRRNTGYVGTPSATDAAYGNYRRRFKNELIARCQAEIQSIKTNPRQPVRHTSSTMAYGSAPSTCNFTGSSAYIYYSDWAAMLLNGWLDAAVPMNYKDQSSNGSMYRSWCDRSVACWRQNRHIYMGLGAYLNPMADTITQLQYAYNAGLDGASIYSYGVPSTDSGNWWSYVASHFYTNTATVPAMPWRNPATATEGMMWGRVKDSTSGLYVDDATVTVEGGPTVKTDGNGYYVATLIPATASGAVHATTASKAELGSHTITNALVLAGDVVRYDFTLTAAPTPLVFAWGDNTFCQRDMPEPVTNMIAVAAGAWHSVALRPDGTVVAWGDNSSGQTSVPGGLQDVVAIAAGGYHSLALRAGGTLVAWGANDYGQINVPAGLKSVIAIAAGTWHSVALRANGTVAVWGDNLFGQLNLPAGLTNVTAVAAGGNHSLALKADGKIVAWGENTDADGKAAGQSNVPWNLAGVMAIAAGDYHSLALKTNGTVVAWGDNSDKQCAVPSDLAGVVAIAGGAAHSLALKADGTIAAWGANFCGQSDLTPFNFRANGMAAGGYHTLALVEGAIPVPRLLNPARTAGRFTASIQTLHRKSYALDYRDSCAGTGWTAVSTNPGCGALLLLCDPAANGVGRFYRMRQW